MAAVQGWRRGFILEVLNIVGLLVGVVAGFMLHDMVADIANQYLHLPGWIIKVLAFVVTSWLIFRFWSWLSAQATESFKVAGLGMGDQILGAVFGLLKTCLVLAAVFWLIEIVKISAVRRQLDESYLAADVVSVGQAEFELLSKSAPLFKRWYNEASSWIEPNATAKKGH